MLLGWPSLRAHPLCSGLWSPLQAGLGFCSVLIRTFTFAGTFVWHKMGWCLTHFSSMYYFCWRIRPVSPVGVDRSVSCSVTGAKQPCWRDYLDLFTQHTPRSIQVQAGWIPPLLSPKSRLKYESSYLYSHTLEDGFSRVGFLDPKGSVYQPIINNIRIPSKTVVAVSAPTPTARECSLPHIRIRSPFFQHCRSNGQEQYCVLFWFCTSLMTNEMDLP